MRRLKALGIFVVWPPVLDGEQPKPFAIGLGDELAELIDPERCCGATWGWLIRSYVNDVAYLAALAAPGS